MKIIRRFLLIGVSLVLLCVAGYSGYRVYTIQHGYSEAKQIYDVISQEYVCYDDNSTEPGTEEIKDNSVAVESSPVKVDFVDLHKNLNPEICAWIWCQDTVINYPVVQHSDNEHYLNYNVNGEASANGAIFLEASNFNDFRDTNNILHGHHMGDVCVLGLLAGYRLPGGASCDVSEYTLLQLSCRFIRRVHNVGSFQGISV